MKGLVLAGGYPQIALIKELKSRGITTILADWGKNPVAKPYADIFYQASTLNVEAIKEIAIKEKIDFLITACTDQALLTVAKISEELGLPCYLDYKTALNVTNKSYMKEMFAKHLVPTAKFVVMEQLDFEKIKDMEFPLIVKPVDCNSSKGVKKVTNEEELNSAFADAVNYSRTNTAIVEDFVSGEEISVDIYVEDGKAHVLCVSNSEKIAAEDKFVIFRGKYPAIADKEILSKIEDTAQKIADAFEIKNSPMLVQLITDGKRIFVLEFSARTGGGVKFQLIKRASGFDVIKAVVDLTLGIKPHFVPQEAESKFISNEFIYCSEGEFARMVGFEELKNKGVISEYFKFKPEGTHFDNEVQNSGDRVGGFTVQGDTAAEITAKHTEARNTLKILDSNGKDIMRHDLLADLKF